MIIHTIQSLFPGDRVTITNEAGVSYAASYVGRGKFRLADGKLVLLLDGELAAGWFVINLNQ